MFLFKRLLNSLTTPDELEKNNRQYRLIRYITWELILVCGILINIYIISHFWWLALVLAIAIFSAFFNLAILYQSKNISFCSHFLTFIIFITISFANFLVWGVGPLHSQWFYVMPIIAASLSGMRGLLIYASACLLLLMSFDKLLIPSYYTILPYQLLIIENLNHLFAYVIIVTTLASLLHENKRFEKELCTKNFLLQIEKDKYHHLASFDPLTNLPNRRYFIQHLHDRITTVLPGQHITVFFIDLDHFKMVNDLYGHNTGDELLLDTAKRLRRCFREQDFISRLGGDEFTATVIHAANKKTPQIIAQRIVKEFDTEIIFKNQINYKYSLSIGFATYPLDAENVSDLIVKADLAMYSAKKISGSFYFPQDDISNA